MAFLDHIDPGNAGGSVPIPDTRFVSDFKPVVHVCTLCGQTFKKLSAMQQHRIEEHPIKRPILLIDGQPLRRDYITVRTPIKPGSIEFKDVDEIFVDGKKIDDRGKLLEWLSRSTPIVLQLELVNQNYPVKYRWSIDISDPNDLDAVDAEFYGVFNTGLPVSQAFSLFNERVDHFSSAAKNYAAGLSCYVTAVLTKDQLPGATLEYHKYGHKLGEAMDILSDYRGRSLADAIFAIAEFMQNDFSLSSSDSCLPKLQVTKRFFNRGVFESVNEHGLEQQPIAIDTVTESIIAFCSGSETERLSRLKGMEALVKTAATGTQDRVKVIFILWCFYRLHGEQKRAAELRGKLVHNHYLGSLIEAIEESSYE
jgi:hypothetical protein